MAIRSWRCFRIAMDVRSRIKGRNRSTADDSQENARTTFVDPHLYLCNPLGSFWNWLFLTSAENTCRGTRIIQSSTAYGIDSLWWTWTRIIAGGKSSCFRCEWSGWRQTNLDSWSFFDVCNTGSRNERSVVSILVAGWSTSWIFCEWKTVEGRPARRFAQSPWGCTVRTRRQLGQKWSYPLYNHGPIPHLQRSGFRRSSGSSHKIRSEQRDHASLADLSSGQQTLSLHFADRHWSFDDWWSEDSWV